MADPYRTRCHAAGHLRESNHVRPVLAISLSDPTTLIVIAVAAIVTVIALIESAGLRVIPNDQVGIVEKLWSPKGSVTEGRIIALGGEAGYQAELLRGGVHFGCGVAVPHP